MTKTYAQIESWATKWSGFTTEPIRGWLVICFLGFVIYTRSLTRDLRFPGIFGPI